MQVNNFSFICFEGCNLHSKLVVDRSYLPPFLPVGEFILKTRGSVFKNDRKEFGFNSNRVLGASALIQTVLRNLRNH